MGDEEAVQKKSAQDIISMKNGKIVMLTAYDFPTAQTAQDAGVDLILVGDSLGMVVLGFSSTRDVTMDMMLHHIAAVRRGADTTHVVGDLPYQSYDTPETAVENAKRMIEAGADSVKVEGRVTEQVRALRSEGIALMGHVGLTPQTATSFKAKGRDEEEADRILSDAQVLEEAGCYSIVLEHMPLRLGKRITDACGIPTIGIGAGVYCDGQVLVYHDVMGMFEGFTPPFVKRYAEIGKASREACRRYCDEVRSGVFPDTQHSTT